MVVVPVVTELVKRFLRQTCREKQEQEADERFHVDLEELFVTQYDSGIDVGSSVDGEERGRHGRAEQ